MLNLNLKSMLALAISKLSRFPSLSAALTIKITLHALIQRYFLMAIALRLSIIHIANRLAKGKKW